MAAQTWYWYEILVQNTSVWQGWPSLCGSLVEIWKLYPWRENEAGFIFSPQAIVAGIILSNVLPYLEVVYTLPSLWKQNQYDCVSVDALGRLGRMEGKPAESGREQAKETSVKPPSWCVSAVAQKMGVKVIGCTEILRPHSNHMKFDKTEVIKQLQLHTDLVKRVQHTWHIWTTFNLVNRTTLQETGNKS